MSVRNIASSPVKSAIQFTGNTLSRRSNRSHSRPLSTQESQNPKMHKTESLSSRNVELGQNDNGTPGTKELAEGFASLRGAEDGDMAIAAITSMFDSKEYTEEDIIRAIKESFSLANETDIDSENNWNILKSRIENFQAAIKLAGEGLEKIDNEGMQLAATISLSRVTDAQNKAIEEAIQDLVVDGYFSTLKREKHTKGSTLPNIKYESSPQFLTKAETPTGDIANLTKFANTAKKTKRVLVNMSGAGLLCGYRAVLSQVDAACSGKAMSPDNPTSNSPETIAKICELKLAVAIQKANQKIAETITSKTGKRLLFSRLRRLTKTERFQRLIRLKRNGSKRASMALRGAIKKAKRRILNNTSKSLLLKNLQKLSHSGKDHGMLTVDELPFLAESLGRNILAVETSDKVDGGVSSFHVFGTEGEQYSRLHVNNQITTEGDLPENFQDCEIKGTQGALGKLMADPKVIVLERFNNDDHFKALQKR